MKIESTLTQMPTLIGGIYKAQENSKSPSFLNVPLFPTSAFSTPCANVCPPDQSGG